MPREIVGVCYEIHPQYVNSLSGKNSKLLALNLAARIVVTGF
jgi:hypothetical protein